MHFFKKKNYKKSLFPNKYKIFDRSYFVKVVTYYEYTRFLKENFGKNKKVSNVKCVQSHCYG